MLDSSAAGKHLPTLSEFYDGKSVFVTGATGFIGSVLLETLLRCCPGAKSIYILVRSKKNEQAVVRKEQIFKKKIFEKLKEETPEVLEKVQVIAGDASLPNLGMNEEDVLLLIEEVSVVFHCAAIISFKKALEFILKDNVLSLNSVIDLCKKMKKFEALVYTSTAFSNCNHLNYPIEEEIKRLPYRAEKFLDALNKEDNEKLHKLVAQCKPDWPNSYTFSKCLAENLIMDTASDLPVAIIRPSIVISTWKHPIPGYVEENSGVSSLTTGAGKGFVTVLLGDPNAKLNLVPADIVANTHVLAAWSLGTKRCASPLVLNCTASDNLDVKLKDYQDVVSKVSRQYPLPRSFAQYTEVTITPYRFLYYIIALYRHYIPAIVLDGMLKITGKKPRVYSLYRYFDTVTRSLNFFLFHHFEFERNNMEYLDKLIHFEDRKDLSLDFKNATFLEMSLDLPKASPFYDWNIDKKSKPERLKIKYRRHLLISCIQGMFLLICCLLIYSVFTFIFQ